MLGKEEWENLCLLARLDPNDESLRGLMDDFNKILAYVETIQAADTSMADDNYTIDDTRNATRSDEPAPTLSLADISAFAPSWESGHFVVPAVIDAE